jgi:hypothetical protein
VAFYAALPAAVFWLLFPVLLLSSFSTGSPLTLLRGEVLLRMARRPGTTFAFVLLSAPRCAAGAAALYATLAYRLYYVLPVVATVLFLYARLVGRYTRLLGRVHVKDTQKVDAKERPRRKKKRRRVQVQDPWAVPDETEPDEMVETYGLARDTTPPRRKARPEPAAVETYDVNPEPPPRHKEVPLDGTPPIEERRIRAESETPLPALSLINGVLTFPWYVSNLGVWGLLTLLFLAWGWLYSGMQGARPF